MSDQVFKTLWAGYNGVSGCPFRCFKREPTDYANRWDRIEVYHIADEKQPMPTNEFIELLLNRYGDYDDWLCADVVFRLSMWSNHEYESAVLGLVGNNTTPCAD